MTNINKIISVLVVSLFMFSATAHSAGWSSQPSESSYVTKAKKDIKDKRYGSAIVQLKKAVTKNPENADAYNLLGYSYRKLKQYELAENYYTQALDLEPKHKGALEYLGELYVETNRIEKAKEMLARLDEACYFSCQEYRQLESLIDEHEGGVEVSSAGDFY